MAAKVSTDGLKQLENFPHLKELSLRGVPVTREVMEIIGRMKRLERLDLRETGVRDNGIAQLTALTTLKDLKLDPTHVTELGLLILRDALPECDLSPSPPPIGD